MKLTPFPQPPVARHTAVRIPRRRLYQGCAVVLILPCVVALLPLQQRAADPIHALAPLQPSAAAAQPAPLPRRMEAAATRLIRHVGRIAPSDPSALSGLASWYGSVLRGHRTASGELFNPEDLTACSRTLPFGTLVRVVNLLNHRSVTVRITDRGALSANRVIDLSSAAAAQIDMLRSGTAPVRLEIQTVGKTLHPGLSAPSPTEGDAESGGGF